MHVAIGSSFKDTQPLHAIQLNKNILCLGAWHKIRFCIVNSYEDFVMGGIFVQLMIRDQHVATYVH